MHLFMFLLLAVWGFLYVSGRQTTDPVKPAGGSPSPSGGDGSGSGGRDDSGGAGLGGGPSSDELY